TVAALAACAAEKQHRFKQMDEALWEKGFKAHQFDKADCLGTAGGCTIVNGFARGLGLELSRFKADMKDCKAELDEGQRELQTFGVGATPSWYINGRYMSGAMPIDSFAVLIDEELAK